MKKIILRNSPKSKRKLQKNEEFEYLEDLVSEFSSFINNTVDFLVLDIKNHIKTNQK